MKANAELLLKGDDRAFRSLIDETPDALKALRAHREALTPMIAGDLHWNERNFETLEAGSEAIELWRKEAMPILDAHRLQRQTLSEAIDGMKIRDDADWETTIDLVFENVFETSFRPALQAGERGLLSRERRLAKAVTRYMTGQMAIFSRFSQLPESAAYQRRIANFLISKSSGMTPADAAQVRQVYEEFLDLLLSKSLITPDDHFTYREVFPLFDPFYLDFESYKGAEVREVVRQVLSR